MCKREKNNFFGIFLFNIEKKRVYINKSLKKRIDKGRKAWYNKRK